MAKLARHLTLMQEVAGSNPGRCIDFFFFLIFFCLHFFFHGKNLAHKELIINIYITQTENKKYSVLTLTCTCNTTFSHSSKKLSFQKLF